MNLFLFSTNVYTNTAICTPVIFWFYILSYFLFYFKSTNFFTVLNKANHFPAIEPCTGSIFKCPLFRYMQLFLPTSLKSYFRYFWGHTLWSLSKIQLIFLPHKCSIFWCFLEHFNLLNSLSFVCHSRKKIQQGQDLIFFFAY